MIEVTWFNVKVELDVIEEFEEGAPEYYRFTFLELMQPSSSAICTEDPYWEPIEDCSYCTLIPANTSSYTLTLLAAILLQRFFDAGVSSKKVCEELSWIDPSWAFAKEVQSC